MKMLKLDTNISIKCGEHIYKFNIDLMRCNRLLQILDFKDWKNQEIYVNNISQTTMQTFLRTLELLHKQNIQINFKSKNERKLLDKKLEIELSVQTKVDNIIYHNSIAFLENTIYVLLSKNNKIEIDVNELKEDINFLHLVKEKYYASNNI
ncbi:hypothetical protein [Fusobacterium phage Fnu1]|uniref:Uncharacterized protein n=1 Tax=Fusobacterium phage Fnu1 TaxID=2530024 RepID=A0A481W5K0_9CAUD|nr:hypothetical protein KMD24_gp064 [Fusobacterium phage Fnu1]QBJ04144.1 hypothetical protein [Fusobacterium phage Fnu1]